MMDLRTLLSDSQSFTTQEVGENCLNLGAADKELGLNKIILHVLCVTADTGLEEGLYINIIDGSGATAGVIDTNIRNIARSRLFLQAAWTTRGQHVQVALPAMRLQQYLGVRYEPHTNPSNGDGEFIAWFDESTESDVTY